MEPNWDLIGLEKSVVALVKSILNTGKTCAEVTKQLPEIVTLAKGIHEAVYASEVPKSGDDIW